MKRTSTSHISEISLSKPAPCLLNLSGWSSLSPAFLPVSKLYVGYGMLSLRKKTNGSAYCRFVPSLTMVVRVYPHHAKKLAGCLCSSYENSFRPLTAKVKTTLEDAPLSSQPSFSRDGQPQLLCLTFLHNLVSRQARLLFRWIADSFHK